jgi:hypothetical protein
LPVRIENLCGEWHFTITDTGKAWVAIRSAVGSSQDAFPETHRSCAAKTRATRSFVMWDVVMLALGFGLFIAGIGYAYACERL